jgi:hypothetical protein
MRGGPRGARTHNPRIKRTQDRGHCCPYLRLSLTACPTSRTSRPWSTAFHATNHATPLRTGAVRHCWTASPQPARPVSRAWSEFHQVLRKEEGDVGQRGQGVPASGRRSSRPWISMPSPTLSPPTAWITRPDRASRRDRRCSQHDRAHRLKFGFGPTGSLHDATFYAQATRAAYPRPVPGSSQIGASGAAGA